MVGEEEEEEEKVRTVRAALARATEVDSWPSTVLQPSRSLPHHRVEQAGEGAGAPHYSAQDEMMSVSRLR